MFKGKVAPPADNLAKAREPVDEMDDKWGYVDKNGRVVIAAKFDYVTDFSMPDQTAGPTF